MPQPLSSYALRVMRDATTALRDLATPMLVWESPDVSEHVVSPTVSGITRTRPGHGEALVFELKKVEGTRNPFAMGVTVGRTPANDIVLPDGSISRFHAYFQKDARSGEWKLVDAESRNGTWVAGLRLAANSGVPVLDGVRLRFGELELLFFQPAGFMSFLKRRLEG